MAFVKVALDAQEPTVAPDGEYDLRLVKAEIKHSGPKAKIPGEPYVSVMLIIEEAGTDYQPFWHTLMVPTEKTDEENVNRYKLNIQRFLACFSIPGDADGFDTDDFPGSVGRANVVQTTNEESGEARNELKLPRLG